MLNSLSNPKADWSNTVIIESSTSDKMSNEILDSFDDIEVNLNDNPRKYGFSLLFRNFVCCSCFTTEHDNTKYKSSSSGYNNVPKSLKTDANGKRQKIDDSKKLESKTKDKSKDKLQDNVVTLCSPLAQNISASNRTDSCFRELKDDESQDLVGSNQTIKMYSESESLLPEISEKNKNKICFIIDLDETLVHSSFKFVKTADIKVNVDIDGTQHEVFVCKRPYADEFLAELGDLFECVLFTASLGKYADPVTNYLDPKGVFEARLFREACAFKEGNYVKDLDAIGRNIDKIVILDNSPVSYLLHPKNALQIVSWFDDPRDTALRDLIPYFKDLAASPLSVPEWLERNRPPETAGILGYPPSNLHWILMQTQSVPEAITIYKQRLLESYHASDSSNASRQSSTRGSGETRESELPHHSLITQVINTNRRKSLVAQETDDDRPPVSSPVARPSSAICLDDDLNDDTSDYLMVTFQDQEAKGEISEAKFVYHSTDQIKSKDNF